MKRNRNHIRIPIQKLTPEQNLQEISLLQDQQGQQQRSTFKQVNINGWINNSTFESAANISKSLNLRLDHPHINNSALTVYQNIKNTNQFQLLHKNNSQHKPLYKIRSQSAQLSSRKKELQELNFYKSTQTPTHAKQLTSSTHNFLRKKSGLNLVIKKKSQTMFFGHSINAINYPIQVIVSHLHDPEQEFKPTIGKIRNMIKQRKAKPNSLYIS